METVYQIAVIVVALYVAAEVGAAIYIFRNRATVLPQIGRTLRHLLGLDQDALRAARIEAVAERNGRKLNYIANHVKFEREQLRKMGLLKDAVPKERDAQANVRQINPFNRN
jgi:hypothetical protein